jgi:hypothetical protein
VWFRVDQLPSAKGEWIALVRKTNTTSPYYAFQLILHNYDDKIYFYVKSADETTSSIHSNSAISTGHWYHVVSVLDGSANMKLYVDGIQQADTDNSGSTYNSDSNLYIGAAYGSANFFDGQIDHVMIFNRALMAEEIQHLYREPFCIFEGVICPAVLYLPIINFAGTSAAHSAIYANLKRIRKIKGSCSAVGSATATLRIVGEVLLAGSAGASSFASGKLTLGYRGPWLKSSLKIQRRWLTGALFNGMTANAFKLGTSLTCGWFWMRPTGCSTLYRGPGMEQIDFTNVLAVVEQDAELMSLPGYIPHCSGSTYFYVIRRFNNCGYQERTLQAAVKVSIDGDGNLAKPQPNNVLAWRADQIDGNKVRLLWFYCPLEQKTKPVCFKVYYGGAAGQIDYENPIAEINYRGRKFYSYRSNALPEGGYLFAIKAEDASGVESDSLAQLKIQLGTKSPDAVNILGVDIVY